MAQPQDDTLPKNGVNKKKEAAAASAQPGKTQVGKASYYHRSLAGRKMANGKPMDPNANIAASKTLPLGTTAKVTNLQNGKSVQVKIEDRGPYVQGRIIDLSPKAAEKLDLIKQGIAPVAVTPVAEPQSDGSGSAGASDGGTSASGGK